MSDDKTYKEILIKLSNPLIKEYENNNFQSNSLSQKNNPKSFGTTFSMPNCLSYMLVQDNDIIIKNIRTTNVVQKSINQNYITFTKATLDSPPIKNIFPLFYSVFTKNSIQNFLINIDFNKNKQNNFLNCNFNKNILNITNQVEFCGETKEKCLRFCLGCENGKVFIVDLKPDYDNNELISSKVKEIGLENKSFFSYITSSFLGNKKKSQKIKRILIWMIMMI